MKEELILETIHPIATDSISQHVIEALQSDGIRFLETEETMLMNLFIVGSTEGLEKVPALLIKQTKKASKNVILFTNPTLDTEEIENVSAYINFGEDKDTNEAIKQFLSLFHETIEVHSRIGFNFHSFMQLIEGHNCIGINTFGYSHSIDEAIKPLRDITIPKEGKCFLFFTVEQYNEQDFPNVLKPINEYLESIPETTDYNWSYNESPDPHISLFISTPLCAKKKQNIFQRILKTFGK